MLEFFLRAFAAIIFANKKETKTKQKEAIKHARCACLAHSWTHIGIIKMVFYDEKFSVFVIFACHFYTITNVPRSQSWLQYDGSNYNFMVLLTETMSLKPFYTFRWSLCVSASVRMVMADGYTTKNDDYVCSALESQNRIQNDLT